MCLILMVICLFSQRPILHTIMPVEADMYDDLYGDHDVAASAEMDTGVNGAQEEVLASTFPLACLIGISRCLVLYIHW